MEDDNQSLFFHDLSTHCTNLTYLNICSQASGELICRLIKNNKSLIYLEMNDCHQVTYYQVFKILTENYFEQLKHIILCQLEQHLENELELKLIEKCCKMYMKQLISCEIEISFSYEIKNSLKCLEVYFFDDEFLNEVVSLLKCIPNIQCIRVDSWTSIETEKVWAN
jgi:hypothetical protein